MTNKNPFNSPPLVPVVSGFHCRAELPTCALLLQCHVVEGRTSTRAETGFQQREALVNGGKRRGDLVSAEATLVIRLDLGGRRIFIFGLVHHLLAEIGARSRRFRIGIEGAESTQRLEQLLVQCDHPAVGPRAVVFDVELEVRLDATGGEYGHQRHENEQLLAHGVAPPRPTCGLDNSTVEISCRRSAAMRYAADC